MTRSSRRLALATGAATIALVVTVPSASAAMMTQTMHLHGGMYTHKAMATAKITEVSTDDYRIQITAEGLPAPDMLHVKPARHAYLAWIINGIDKKSMMGVVPLHAQQSHRQLHGEQGRDDQARQRGIVVTADKGAMQHMPTMPEVTVLTSSMKSGM